MMEKLIKELKQKATYKLKGRTLYFKLDTLIILSDLIKKYIDELPEEGLYFVPFIIDKDGTGEIYEYSLVIKFSDKPNSQELRQKVNKEINPDSSKKIINEIKERNSNIIYEINPKKEEQFNDVFIHYYNYLKNDGKFYRRANRFLPDLKLDIDEHIYLELF